MYWKMASFILTPLRPRKVYFTFIVTAVTMKSWARNLNEFGITEEILLKTLFTTIFKGVHVKLVSRSRTTVYKWENEVTCTINYWNQCLMRIILVLPRRSFKCPRLSVFIHALYFVRTKNDYFHKEYSPVCLYTGDTDTVVISLRLYLQFQQEHSEEQFSSNLISVSHTLHF